MSWFDSSFSFARTALSQAQRSIDKVLDIREGKESSQVEPEPDSSLKETSPQNSNTTAASGSPSSSDGSLSSSEKPAALSKSVPLSTSRSSHSTSTPKTHQNRPPVTATGLTSTPGEAAPSEDSFTRTWGGSESLWNSFTSPLSKKAEVKPSPGATKQSKSISQRAAKETEGPAHKSSTSSSSSTPTGRGQKGRESTASKQASVGRQLHTSEPAKPVAPAGKAGQERVSRGTADKPSKLADKGELVDIILSESAGEEKVVGGEKDGTLQGQRTGKEKSKLQLASEVAEEQDGGGANSNAPPTTVGQSGGGVVSGALPVTSSWGLQFGQTSLPVQHSVLTRTPSTPATEELDGGGGREEVAEEDGKKETREDKAREGRGDELEGLPIDSLGVRGERREAVSEELPSPPADVHVQDTPSELSNHDSLSHSTTLGSVQTEPPASMAERETTLKQATERKPEERGSVLEEVPLPELPPTREHERDGLRGLDSAPRANGSSLPISPSSTSAPPLVEQTSPSPPPPPTSPLPPTHPHSASSPVTSSHLATAPEPEIKSTTGQLAQMSGGVLENMPAWKEEGKEGAEVQRYQSQGGREEGAALNTDTTAIIGGVDEKRGGEGGGGGGGGGGEGERGGIKEEVTGFEGEGGREPKNIAGETEGQKGKGEGRGERGGGGGGGGGGEASIQEGHMKAEDESSGATREATVEPRVLPSAQEMEALTQELAQVKKVLEARENRMIEMSREIVQLNETNQQLQSQLSSTEETLRSSEGGLDDLRSEFTKRISSTEKKLQTVIKERDSLRKQLQVLMTEHSHQKRSAEQELTALLKEKEEQITGLMEEGEKLSKKELQNSNIIKKLKEKNKQNDQLLTAQRQQIEDTEREVARLKEVVRKKEENERKYQESLSQLNTIAERQDKELTALKTERDDLLDKVRSLQSNLDGVYKELSELHKANAVNKTAAHEALLSAEQTARQELTCALENQRVEAQREKESLLLQISELRASVSRAEQQAAWREEHMKQEVADMQRRLQEAEMRNQELTASISQTTKPFLRQIETLHSAHSTQTANWEKVEANLTQRLVEAQTQLSVAAEKERNATEKALTLQSRVAVLENQTATLRQEKSRLMASLELEKAKAETLEEGQQREFVKTEAVRASLQQSLEELRKEKEMLERQLEYERVRLEAESKKACLESQEKERLRSQLANSLSRGFSRQSSTASTPTHSQSEILEKSLVREMSEGGGSVSAMDSLRHSKVHATSASVIEQLQSLLKQKEGELANAQNLVSSLERSRAAMANDLAAVSTQNVELSEKVEAIPLLQNKLQELEKHNEALLQMYGEKAEETEELKLDIQDLKDMYRQQIDHLTSR